MRNKIFNFKDINMSKEPAEMHGEHTNVSRRL